MVNKYSYYIYLLSNKGNSVIYIGVTNNIQQRVWQHKQKIHDGFTKRYDCTKLVYFEQFQWIQDAIAREKQLKGGSRQQKIDLINGINPEWVDLSSDWY